MPSVLLRTERYPVISIERNLGLSPRKLLTCVHFFALGPGFVREPRGSSSNIGASDASTRELPKVLQARFNPAGSWIQDDTRRNPNLCDRAQWQ